MFDLEMLMLLQQQVQHILHITMKSPKIIVDIKYNQEEVFSSLIFFMKAMKSSIIVISSFSFLDSSVLASYFLKFHSLFFLLSSTSFFVSTGSGSGDKDGVG